MVWRKRIYKGMNTVRWGSLGIFREVGYRKALIRRRVGEVKEREDAPCEYLGIMRGVQRKRECSRGNRRSNHVGLYRPKYRLPIVAE